MPRILAINGAYREGGTTDQAVAAVARAAEAAGADVEEIRLRDHPIGFCLNCRECTQRPGPEPGECVQDDAMAGLIARIEAADGYILASPTNCGTVTALFKRFMERLVVYTYWPWGRSAPRLRKMGLRRRPAILVSSCAAPVWPGRLLFDTHRALKATARTIGARPAGTLFIGLAATRPQPGLSARAARKAGRLGVGLARKARRGQAAVDAGSGGP